MIFNCCCGSLQRTQSRFAEVNFVLHTITNEAKHEKVVYISVLMLTWKMKLIGVFVASVQMTFRRIVVYMASRHFLKLF